MKVCNENVPTVCVYVQKFTIYLSKSNAAIINDDNPKNNENFMLMDMKVCNENVPTVWVYVQNSLYICPSPMMSL